MNAHTEYSLGPDKPIIRGTKDEAHDKAREHGVRVHVYRNDPETGRRFIGYAMPDGRFFPAVQR